MTLSRRTWWTMAVLAIGGLIAVGGPAQGDDTKPDAPKAADAKKSDEDKPADKPEDKADDEAEKDPFEVPQDADGAALVKYIEDLQQVRPKLREEAQKRLTAVKSAATKAMELEKESKDGATYRKANYFLISVYIGEIASAKPEEQKAMVAAAKDYIAGAKSIAPEDAYLGYILAQRLEFTGKTELAKEAYQAFSDVLSKSDSTDERVKKIASAMAGTLKRMNLLGNRIEIKGKQLDGKDFDWDSYSKGKVVLIDFWATWCGPCIAELPNVKRNYDKYHAKGFEILGVSLDTDREKLVKFLEKEETAWTQLFARRRGWQHPVAVEYGIQSIPTVILVDKDCKVVSLNARGPELGKLLEKLLGSADEAKDADKKDEEKEEKTGAAK